MKFKLSRKSALLSTALLTAVPLSFSTCGLAAQDDPVTPITVRQANDIFDASRFAAPGGLDAENDATPLMSTFSIYDMDRKEATARARRTFESAGWKVVRFDDSHSQASSLQVKKDGLFVTCSISQRGSSKLQLFINVQGNVDLRTIEKAQPESVEHDRADFTMYRSDLTPDQVIASYDSALGKNGWPRCKAITDDHYPDETRTLVRYRHNGVYINVIVEPRDGAAIVMANVGMLERDIPTPTGATDLRLDDNLFSQSFRSKLTVGELLDFFIPEFRGTGWIMVTGRRFKDEMAGMYLTHARYDPVFLEIVKQKDGHSSVYMARPTRQVQRVVKSTPEFEIEYDKSLPLGKSQMHSVPYTAIPFHQPLAEGSGRTIAESVFYNTASPMEENFEFYRDYFTKLGWEAGQREDEFIGDSLFRATVPFTKGDARIEVSSREWGEAVIRITIDGNGIQFPGNRFCHMMPRAEASEIEWSIFPDSANIADDKNETVKSDESDAGLSGEMEKMPAEEEEHSDNRIAGASFPVPDNAQDVNRDGDLEMISFDVDTVRPHVEFYRKAMTEQGWKEDGQSFADNEFAALTFTKDGTSIQISLATDDRRSPPVRAIIQGDGIRWQ